MALKVKLSQIKALPFDFDAEVTKYIAALVAHQKTVGEAASTAPHPWIELAVKRVQYPIEAVHQPTNESGEPVGEPVKFMSSEKPDTFERDVEIEDDTPSPPTLDEQKAKLAADAIKAADAAVAVFFPPLKRRLFQIHADRARSTLPPEKRTPEQVAIIAAADAIDAKANAVQLHLAQIEDAIHDLTADNIDGYAMPPFPT